MGGGGGHDILSDFLSLSNFGVRNSIATGITRITSLSELLPLSTKTGIQLARYAGELRPARTQKAKEDVKQVAVVTRKSSILMVTLNGNRKRLETTSRNALL